MSERGASRPAARPASRPSARPASRPSARPASRPTARPSARSAVRRGANRPGPAAQADPARRYALIKWALLAALIVYGVLVVGANSARDVDFNVVASALSAAPGVDALNPLDENGFQERLEVAPEGCEGWLMYGADEIMDVSELMVARADAATLDRLEAAARGRVEAQMAVFRSYGVEQKALLEGAIMLRRGQWLFYAVGERATQWEDIFLSRIR